MSESDNLKLNCSKCGAQQCYSPGQRSIKCDFCGSETEIPRDEDILSGINESDFIVPLRVEKKDLESATMGYMATGDFTPDDILEKSILIKQWLYYVPTYMFSGAYEASWTATFGYDRTEHFTEYVSTYENGRWSKEPVSKTKTVTDWRPVNGSDSGEFCVQVYAGKRLDERAVDLIENATLVNKITDFKSEYLMGLDVEDYVLREQDAYENSGKYRLDSIVEYGVKSHAQGDRQRDWHWTANINKSTTTVLMPVAHSIFEYEGKQYNVWLDGSDSERMVGDALPVDHGRKGAASRGFIPLYVCLAVLVASFIGGLSILLIPASISIALLVGYGVLRKHQMINHSKEVRSSYLIQKKASSNNTDNMSEDERKSLISSYHAPKIPVTANPKNDKFILPLVSALGLLLILAPGLISNSGVESPGSSGTPQDMKPSEQTAMGTSSVESSSSQQTNADPAIALLEQATSSYQQGNYVRTMNLIRRVKELNSTDPFIEKSLLSIEGPLSNAFIQKAEDDLSKGLYSEASISLKNAIELNFGPHKDRISQLSIIISDSEYSSESVDEQNSSSQAQSTDETRAQAEAELAKARRDELIAERELLAERRRLAEQATAKSKADENLKSQIRCEYSNSQPLSCASRDRKPVSCSWNFESCGMPTLLKQQSKTTCSGKMSVNTDENQLIVTDGCRGLFVPEISR